MKRPWTSEELQEAWTLGPEEHALLPGKRGSTRLGFAVLMRFFARLGRFPAPEEILGEAVEYVAPQVDVSAEEYRAYDHRGRTAEYHRAQIREAFGFRQATLKDAEGLGDWLLEDVAPREYDTEKLKDAAYARLRALKVEPPTPGRVDRIARSALKRYDGRFCETTLGRLPENAANSFIFYGKGGEIATNRIDDQEVAVLSLHLLQLSLVYVNTLMIQEVLASPAWSGRLTDEDTRGLTPLLYAHVNPYGRFDLDMSKRLPLADATHTS